MLGILAVTAATVAGLAFERQQSLSEQATVAMRSAPQITYTAPPVLPLVSVVGDSYTGGSAMNSAGNAHLWWSLAEQDLHIQVQELAFGGSGYVATGPAGQNGTTFVQRATRIFPRTDLIVFFGSRNDGPDGLASAAEKAYQEAKVAAPDAKLLVIGPPWVNGNPPPSIIADRDAIHAAAVAAHADWVDPIADHWFPNGNTLIGSDGVHPTDVGHQHLASLIEPILRKELGLK